MVSLARSAVIVAMFCLSMSAFAQSGAQESAKAKGGTGSISGRVTIGGKPAAGVIVLLFPGQIHQQIETLAARTTTDGEGHYLFADVPPGPYVVSPHALAYTAPRGPGAQVAGKPVLLDEGTVAEGVDLALVRGGAIMGRVTDSDGHPVVGTRVEVYAVGEGDGQPREVRPPDDIYFHTDDRGVYRLFGLPAGRYVVAVGSGDDGHAPIFGGMRALPRTYHPAAPRRALATVVEVSSGGETNNVDIAVARAAKTFTVSGRIVDAETGAPVSQYSLTLGRAEGGTDGLASYAQATNARGEFRVSGLLPGRYLVGARPASPSVYCGATITVDVDNADAAGLEIKLVRGATISGTVSLEGTEDPDPAGQFGQMEVMAYLQDERKTKDGIVIAHSTSATTPVNPDGSFRLTGVTPGTNILELSARRSGRRSGLLSGSRVEHNGAEMRDVDVAAGEELTNVRIVGIAGGGSVRGHVDVRGGALPDASRLAVRFEPIDKRLSRWVMTDTRGHFLIENLPPGQYTAVLVPFIPNRADLTGSQYAQKSVNVSKGATAEISFDLDLSPKK